MACTDCDGRNNCPEHISSACIDYIGKVSKLIKDLIPCKPNLNDVLEETFKLLDALKQSLGDNRLLDKKTLTFNSLIVTQEELNQIFIDKLGELETAISHIGDSLTLNATNILMSIDLLCIENALCTPLATYTLAEILLKMRDKICDHETRIAAIETFLGI